MSKDANNVYRLAHTMIRVKDLESSFNFFEGVNPTAA